MLEYKDFTVIFVKSEVRGGGQTKKSCYLKFDIQESKMVAHDLESRSRLLTNNLIKHTPEMDQPADLSSRN